MQNEHEPGIYLTIEQAATRLGKKQRQIYNYIKAEKLRTRKVGRETFINSEDVEALARELGSSLQQDAISTDIAIATTQLAQTRRELAILSEQLGQIKEQRDARPTPEEMQRWRDRTIAAEARAQALEEQIEYLKLPFWKKLFR